MTEQKFTGRVKWYKPDKGYGFIVREGKEPGMMDDDFVHAKALEVSGIKYLLENEKVTYEIATHKGRPTAVNIQKVA